MINEKGSNLTTDSGGSLPNPNKSQVTDVTQDEKYDVEVITEEMIPVFISLLEKAGLDVTKVKEAGVNIEERIREATKKAIAYLFFSFDKYLPKHPEKLRTMLEYYIKKQIAYMGPNYNFEDIFTERARVNQDVFIKLGDFLDGGSIAVDRQKINQTVMFEILNNSGRAGSEELAFDIDLGAERDKLKAAKIEAEVNGDQAKLSEVNEKLEAIGDFVYSPDSVADFIDKVFLNVCENGMNTNKERSFSNVFKNESHSD